MRNFLKTRAPRNHISGLNLVHEPPGWLLPYCMVSYQIYLKHITSLWDSKLYKTCQKLLFTFFKFQIYLSCSSSMSTMSHRKPFQCTAFKLTSSSMSGSYFDRFSKEGNRNCLLVVVKAQFGSHSGFSYWLPSSQPAVLDPWTNWS